MIYALESGNISFITTTYQAGDTADYHRQHQRRIKFAGFCGNKPFKSGLSNPKVRSAINLSISRGICANAFAGRARPADPVQSVVESASGLKGFDEREKIDTAVAQLNEAGYNKGNSQKKLSLELLVGKENSFRVAAAGLLKNQLARAGVEIKITELPHTELIKRLKSGKFDLYIGEIRLSANMSLKPVLARDGSAAYGVNRSGEAAAAYSKYLNGEIDMQQFTDVFTKSAVHPAVLENGIAAYNRSLSKVATAFCAYYGIENWTYQ